MVTGISIVRALSSKPAIASKSFDMSTDPYMVSEPVRNECRNRNRVRELSEVRKS